MRFVDYQDMRWYEESSILTDDMLNNDFDSSQWHVAARYFIGGSRAPFIGWNGLQKMLNGGE